MVGVGFGKGGGGGKTVCDLGGGSGIVGLDVKRGGLGMNCGREKGATVEVVGDCVGVDLGSVGDVC